MALTLYHPDDALDYIPEFAGNRASDDPCVVRLHYLGYARIQKYQRQIAARAKHDKDNLTEIYQEVQRRQFVENVEKISGFFIGDREVTKPEEFYELGDVALVTEVIKAMENPMMLREGLRE